MSFWFAANVKELYERATAPPEPSPPPTPQPKRTQADWERDQREVSEEKAGRDALKKKKIPSYFDSEFGKAFLLTQAKDVDEILRELSADPRKDGTEAVRGQLSGQSGQQMSPVTSAYPARCMSKNSWPFSDCLFKVFINLRMFIHVHNVFSLVYSLWWIEKINFEWFKSPLNAFLYDISYNFWIIYI